MRILTLLNSVAFVLLFTPFFQMCSDEGNGITDGLQQNIALDSVARNAEPVIVGERLEEDKPVLEAFWEQITIPGENFTVTAFGLLVVTVFDLAEGHYGDIWFGSILTISSLCLTVTCLVLLIRNRTRRFNRLVLINLAILLITFAIALMTFDSIRQIKWGYYSYFVVTAVIYLKTAASMPRLEQAGSDG